ncbi:hypothetical protein BP6252_04869 [Coleophoma cylindrospora]|uniref:Uncharacterized protein n=1 Tax=Coleophoma cylindrospora TaxID=1849047 RepID=A0A3D8S2A0_9HELO|nr:hypothetical protein BP6252_04869 [Coleophoma cylindrospora]
MSRQQTIRRVVWTGAIASTTAVGAWYGAGLKTQQEIKTEIKKRHEATPAEKIAQLEESRGALVAKRLGLERKIEEIERRKSGATLAESKVGRERTR